MSEEIDCPRARSSMTPCVVRDGALACSGQTPGKGYETVVCVGCGASPRQLLLDLSQEYEPARRYRQTHDPLKCADALMRLTVE